MSYADASDTGPCEGRLASPSNPTGADRVRANEPRSETVVFRCTAAEKAALRAKAEAAGRPVATLLRDAMTGAQARRPRPVPKADPALLRAVSRIGGNLNQVARWLNTAARSGRMSEIEAVDVAARLVIIERQLDDLLAAEREDRSC